jgi:hypothetical protein
VKKFSIIVLTMLIFLAFSGSGVLAADDGIVNLGTRTITDVNKTWTITFNKPIDFTSVTGNIEIKDITSDKSLSITPVQGDNKAVVKVAAPSGGYTLGHNYQISINKNIKLASGGLLARAVTLNFIVASKDNNAHTISASVIVSPIFSAFKQITIISTNIPGAAKYKVEGSNKLFDIGKTMVSIIGANTTKVYIYDSNGNVLGTASMDVSTTKNNISLNFQQQ